MLRLVLWFYSILFVCALKRWYQIPNHDEEIFVNYEDQVIFREAKIACQERNAINLVLYKKPVLEFMARIVMADLRHFISIKTSNYCCNTVPGMFSSGFSNLFCFV